VLSDAYFPTVLGAGKRWYGSMSELRHDEEILDDSVGNIHAALRVFSPSLVTR
jgi:hypothetical protein